MEARATRVAAKQRRKAKSIFSAEFLEGVYLDMRNPREAEIAHLLALLTLRWGRLEYMLYLILEAIDPRRSEEWIAAFFRTNSLGARIKAVRKEIVRETAASFPEFERALDEALALFSSVRTRRNTLVHGVWRRTGRWNFKIFPMRQNQTTKKLEPEVSVTIYYVAAIIKDTNKLSEQLAQAGVDMMLHRMLDEDARWDRIWSR